MLYAEVEVIITSTMNDIKLLHKCEVSRCLMSDSLRRGVPCMYMYFIFEMSPSGNISSKEAPKLGPYLFPLVTRFGLVCFFEQHSDSFGGSPLVDTMSCRYKVAGGPGVAGGTSFLQLQPRF